MFNFRGVLFFVPVQSDHWMVNKQDVFSRSDSSHDESTVIDQENKHHSQKRTTLASKTHVSNNPKTSTNSTVSCATLKEYPAQKKNKKHHRITHHKSIMTMKPYLLPSISTETWPLHLTGWSIPPWTVLQKSRSYLRLKKATVVSTKLKLGLILIWYIMMYNYFIAWDIRIYMCIRYIQYTS